LSSVTVRPPPASPLFPYTTLFRSPGLQREEAPRGHPTGRDLVVEELQHVARDRVAHLVRLGQSAGGVPLIGGYHRDDLGRVHLEDRKSTRLNSSHVKISYAVFCLK